MGNEFKEYSPKPITVKAYQWDGEPNEDIVKLEDSGQIITSMQFGRRLGWFKTSGTQAALLKGRIVQRGDYVIIEDGQKSFKTKAEFEAHYEEVAEEAAELAEILGDSTIGVDLAKVDGDTTVEVYGASPVGKVIGELKVNAKQIPANKPRASHAKAGK